MLNDWFYSHGSSAVALAVCAALVLPALLGVWVCHRLVSWPARQRDNRMIGLSYALAGAIYAVLITFVAVGVYDNMDKGEAIADQEANALTGLAFETAGLPAPLAGQLRAALDRYVDIVTRLEWPQQQAYAMAERNFTAGWAQLQEVNLAIAKFAPATPGQATVKLQMLHGINDLFGARRARILAAAAHLPDAIWQMLLSGLVLIAVYIWLFGPHSFRLHLAVTGLTMASIGLVFSLIIGVDYPFRGDLGVSDEPYLSARQTADQVFMPDAGEPGAPAASPGPPD